MTLRVAGRKSWKLGSATVSHDADFRDMTALIAGIDAWAQAAGVYRRVHLHRATCHIGTRVGERLWSPVTGYVPGLSVETH
jgi:hypothetical protein